MFTLTVFLFHLARDHEGKPMHFTIASLRLCRFGAWVFWNLGDGAYEARPNLYRNFSGLFNFRFHRLTVSTWDYSRKVPTW